MGREAADKTVLARTKQRQQAERQRQQAPAGSAGATRTACLVLAMSPAAPVQQVGASVPGGRAGAQGRSAGAVRAASQARPD